MSLRTFPYEVVSIITEYIDIEDIFNLALSCTHFHYLLKDDRRCNIFLNKLAPATSEAKEAAQDQKYARALRRLVKRRQAIRNATPFTAGIIAVAESWLYEAGVLCYLQEQHLRVLDLHRSAETETVMDVRGLLREACLRQSSRSRLELLHYAAGFVTCLYTRGRQSWLLVIDVKAQRLFSTSPVLEYTNKIFVRNDADFLYFGTHSEFGADGFRRWVLMSYDIKSDKWLEQKVHLMDMVGSDIGQSICFEIIDDTFYGLSNQTSFEVDEADWTSYYHCFSFPVGKPHKTERSDREPMWRRQHADGPIDDRWSFIRLTKNEATGKLQVLESRKEWLNRSSSGQRTYYTTDLEFEVPEDEEEEEEEADATAGPANPLATNSTATVQDSGYDSSSTSTSTSTSGSNSPLQTPQIFRTIYEPPTATATRLRDPHKTHIGDDASTALLFTFSKVPMRSYHLPSQTFLDLVDDPALDSTKTRLRLRAGSRQLVPFSDLQNTSNDALLAHTESIPRLYKNGGANDIAFWPPEPASAAVADDAGKLQQLTCIMNPPSHTGGTITSVWDERSLVYSVGSNTDGVQALVFVSFDPAIRLRGLPIWDEQQQQAVPEQQSKANEEANTAALSNAQQEEYMHLAAPDYLTEEELAFFDKPVCGGSRGKGKELETFIPDEAFGATWGLVSPMDADACSPVSSPGCSSGDEAETVVCAAVVGPGASSSAKDDAQQLLRGHDDSSSSSSAHGKQDWAWVRPAMYREIGFGFNSLPDSIVPNGTSARAAGHVQ